MVRRALLSRIFQAKQVFRPSLLSTSLPRVELAACSRSTDRWFSKNKDDKEDLFGVHSEDTLGPLPPKYKRDATTGRFTGEVEIELSEEERKLLNQDPVSRDATLMRRVEQHYREAGTDEAGLPAELDPLGRRIREANMGLNVLGRSVKAQAAKEVLDDGKELGRDDSGFSQHLTQAEFKSFAEFMKEKHNLNVSKDDLPVLEHDNSQSSRKGLETDSEDDPDNLNLSTKWLTARAQRQMDDLLDDNPYSDLLPGDLSPQRLVNRKRAKPIPVKELHHNNLALLQRFITPSGQVMNRVQTRLGARDQRRVSKLIKRARSLGLLPYVGQFKVEQHGWVHSPDVTEERDWEKELVQRGLVIRRSENDDE